MVTIITNFAILNYVQPNLKTNLKSMPGTNIVCVIFSLDKLSSKAQFRRRASAVPNLIVIRFNCGTAETRL